MFCQLVPSSRYCLFQHIIVVRTIVFTNLNCKSYQNHFVWYLMTRQIDMQSIRSTPDYVHPTMYTRLCRPTPDYVPQTMYTRLCTPAYVHPAIYTGLSTPDYVHPTMYTRLCTPTVYTRLCTPDYVHPAIYTRLSTPDYTNCTLYAVFMI